MMGKVRCLFFLFSFIFIHSIYANRIGIIGGGASGLISAWLLEEDHDVTLFEASSRLGGHANTVDVSVGGKTVHMEAGAEFFNNLDFPHFLKLLHYYDVPLQKFTLVSTFYTKDGNDKIILPTYHDGEIEWSSLSPTNIWRSLKLSHIVSRSEEIIDSHFNRETLKNFVEEEEHSDSFLNEFFYPYIGASYGVSPEDVRDFTAYNAMYYVTQGSRLQGYQWYEVPEGLSYYVNKVANDLHRASVHLSTPVSKVTHEHGLYQIYDEKNNMREFDTLIMAANAQIAGKLLETVPGRKELSNTLKSMRYYDAEIAIHGDSSFMPPDKKDWRVVNTVFNGHNSAMTAYKHWHSEVPVFKSWLVDGVNKQFGRDAPLPKPLYALAHYRHPFLDVNFAKSRDLVNQQQGIDNLWFGGVWATDVDSHESAIFSAIKIARSINSTSRRLSIID